MNFSQLTETVDEKLEEIRLIREGLVIALRDNIGRAFKGYFDANPDEVAVAWHQYTPYFNDGDPCEFTIGDVGFFDVHYVKETGVDVESEEVDTYEGRWNGEEDEQAISRFIEGLDDLAEALWGNNVKVVVTRRGIKVYDYDCGF